MYATQAMAEQAATRLAALAVDPELPEIAELRARIKSLEEQRDPDLAEAIERKRSRLESLLSAPETDRDLARKISDPRWFDSLTYEELTLVLHQVVQRIVITKKVPTALALKL